MTQATQHHRSALRRPTTKPLPLRKPAQPTPPLINSRNERHITDRATKSDQQNNHRAPRHPPHKANCNEHRQSLKSRVPKTSQIPLQAHSNLDPGKTTTTSVSFSSSPKPTQTPSHHHRNRKHITRPAASATSPHRLKSRRHSTRTTHFGRSAHQRQIRSNENTFEQSDKTRIPTLADPQSK